MDYRVFLPISCKTYFSDCDLPSLFDQDLSRYSVHGMYYTRINRFFSSWEKEWINRLYNTPRIEPELVGVLVQKDSIVAGETTGINKPAIDRCVGAKRLKWDCPHGNITHTPCFSFCQQTPCSYYWIVQSWMTRPIIFTSYSVK